MRVQSVGSKFWMRSIISKPTRGAKNLLGAASEISQDLITFKQCLKEHPWLIFLLHGSGLKNSSSCESKSSFSGLNLSESFSKQTLYTQCVASGLSEGEDLEQQVNATPPPITCNIQNSQTNKNQTESRELYKRFITIMFSYLNFQGLSWWQICSHHKPCFLDSLLILPSSCLRRSTIWEQDPEPAGVDKTWASAQLTTSTKS